MLEATRRLHAIGFQARTDGYGLENIETGCNLTGARRD